MLFTVSLFTCTCNILLKCATAAHAYEESHFKYIMFYTDPDGVLCCLVSQTELVSFPQQYFS